MYAWENIGMVNMMSGFIVIRAQGGQGGKKTRGS